MAKKKNEGVFRGEDGTWRYVIDWYVDNHRVRQQKGGYRYKAEAQQAMDAAIRPSGFNGATLIGMNSTSKCVGR